MPLDVVEANVILEALESGPPAERAEAPRAPMSLAERHALKERLRPLVLEILDEALERHRRSQGR
jgi:hypothetical protein